MELQQFPFDQQALNVSLAINCRVNGMTPVVLTIDDQGTFVNAIESRFFHLQVPSPAIRCQLPMRMHLTALINAIESRFFHLCRTSGSLRRTSPS